MKSLTFNYEQICNGMSLKVEAMILRSSDIIWVEFEKYWDYYSGHPSPQAEVVSTQVTPYFEGFVSPLQSILQCKSWYEEFHFL